MNDTPQLALDRQLCFALYAAQRAMTRRYRPVLEPLGLTYPQYLVLLALWERDGVRVRDLGERLFLDSGTLTPLLKRLQARGLVDRRRDPADERVVRVHLTEQGRALRSEVACVPEAVFGEVADEAAHAAEALRTALWSLHHTLTEEVP